MRFSQTMVFFARKDKYSLPPEATRAACRSRHDLLVWWYDITGNLQVTVNYAYVIYMHPDLTWLDLLLWISNITGEAVVVVVHVVAVVLTLVPHLWPVCHYVYVCICICCLRCWLRTTRHKAPSPTWTLFTLSLFLSLGLLTLSSKFSRI